MVRLYEVEPRDPAADALQGDAESRRHRFSPTLLEDFRDQSFQTISAVSAAETGPLTFSADGETQRVSRATLSPEGFGILGIVPVIGRLPAESQTELLLSERFWQTGFGADPAVIGSTISAGAQPLRIVGVMGLVAARRVDGRHDRSIRLALGASEGRLLRGSLVESVLLAFSDRLRVC